MEVITKRHRSTEKGIALFIAIFALMLLSAIGLAMVFSADTETSIDSNFRDQQLATYAALSGLQEARDRLIKGSTLMLNGTATSTVSGKLTWPADLPSASAANIIYIINPRSGETIQPWNKDNKYFDWELCDTSKETMPANFCSGGNPPNSSTWYTVIDDSNSTAGASWTRTVPLNFKWVRINLKAHNMVTPVPVITQSDTSLVCWTGLGQIDMPSGYNKDCSPNGALSGINLPVGATGYTGTPSVSIAAPPSGGTQAVAQAVVTTTDTGAISTVTLDPANPGSNYTSAPTVTFSGGGGTGATAVATIVPANSHSLASVSMSSAGSPTGCFASSTAPTVNIVPTNGGSGASASATMSSTASCVASWTVGGTCSTLAGTTQTVTTGNGGGSGFSGTITFKNGTGKVSTTTPPVILNPGSGYTSVPTGSAVTIAGGCATITFTMGYQMTGVTMTSAGTGYIGVPNVTFGTAPVTGGTPTAAATLAAGSPNAGQIASLTLTSGGTGYTSTPTVVFTGGGGSGAIANATLATTKQVTGFDFSCSGCSYGSGYIQPPNVTISGSGGPTKSTTGIIGGTTYYGQIVQVTSYAETPTLSNRQGSRAMLQEELTTAPRSPFQFQIGGAITVPGPDPNFGTPNSQNFYVKGTDAASCGQTPVAKPSIDVYDPNNSGAIDAMIGQLSRPDHYPGMQASPDVENGTGISGTPTPSALQQFVDTLQSMTPSGQMYQSTSPINPNPATFQTFALNQSQLNPTSNPPITFVQGNATINGSFTGSGILVVTGTLTLGGNYTFNGLILVIGQGQVVYNGGGSGQVNGSIYVAKINDTNGAQLSTLGTPTLDYSGGGGNGVQYDHCYADNLLGNIPQVPPAADPNPLTVISQRTIYR